MLLSANGTAKSYGVIPGRWLRDGKPLRKANGMPFTLPFSPDTGRPGGRILVGRDVENERPTPFYA
jgi:hypothetical protein